MKAKTPIYLSNPSLLDFFLIYRKKIRYNSYTSTYLDVKASVHSTSTDIRAGYANDGSLG